MATISDKVQQVRDRIARACAGAGRDVRSVTLLAVSKRFDAQAVREAVDAGLHRFGENYVAEALPKMAALSDLRERLEWHLIGPLQANKTRLVAQQFDWVHTVDRLKIAQRLSEQRPSHLPPLQICLQVNVSGELSKSGLPWRDVPTLARAVAELPRLTLRGLMSIPEPTPDLAAQRASHRALAEMLGTLRSDGLALDTLSMGMSADLEAAIAEGATVVRIGEALFGRRAVAPDADVAVRDP